MSVYGGPVACAEDCITTCRETRGGYLGLVPIYPDDPDAYGRCLHACQTDCPGGAPDYQPGLCEEDLACRWGLAGEVVVTIGGVAADAAGLLQRGGEQVLAATQFGTGANLLLVGAALVVGYALLRR